MKNKQLIFIGFLGLTLASCATTHRGVVAMKLDANEAHVGMGKGELKVGDHVDLYHNRCTPTGNLKQSGGNRTCTKVEGGHGVVTNVLNEDYSVVKFEPGVEFAEGDAIEMHAH